VRAVQEESEESEEEKGAAEATEEKEAAAEATEKEEAAAEEKEGEEAAADAEETERHLVHQIGIAHPPTPQYPSYSYSDRCSPYRHIQSHCATLKPGALLTPKCCLLETNESSACTDTSFSLIKGHTADLEARPRH